MCIYKRGNTVKPAVPHAQADASSILDAWTRDANQTLRGLDETVSRFLRRRILEEADVGAEIEISDLLFQARDSVACIGSFLAVKKAKGGRDPPLVTVGDRVDDSSRVEIGP